jgi:hypothetical protein
VGVNNTYKERLMKITQQEWRIVEIYLASMRRKGRDEVKPMATDVVVTRRSDRLFDLSVEGKIGDMGFSAWLVLGCIATRLNWCLPEVANMTDYPTMTMGGDWSGVRDTDDSKLWTIFDHFKLGEVKSNEQVIIN